MGETDDFPEPRKPGPDRRDNIASAGLDPDTWVAVEKWRTKRRLKRSEAVRRLIRNGLRPKSTRRRPVAGVAAAAGIAYALMFLFISDAAAGIVGGIFIGVVLLWAIVPSWRE